MKFKFRLKVSMFVPDQTVEVEADSEEEAEEKIDKMWENGELDWLADKAELNDLEEVFRSSNKE